MEFTGAAFMILLLTDEINELMDSTKRSESYRVEEKPRRVETLAVSSVVIAKFDAGGSVGGDDGGGVGGGNGDGLGGGGDGLWAAAVIKRPEKLALRPSG